MATKSNDLVEYILFKDSGKYNDDVFVGYNGKSYIIKRGVPVKLPRPVYEILKQSMEQDNKTADFIQHESENYRMVEKKNNL